MPRFQQHAFDLRREHVDAADDQHVVGAAARLAHAHRRAAAGALLVVQRADVTRAVAQQRQRLLADAGEHELAVFAVGQRLAGRRVDDLGVEEILVDVHAVLLDALARNARARDFRKAVDVVGLDGQQPLDLAAHLLGPRLRAEDAGPEAQALRVDALVAHGLADVHRVRRRAAEDVRAVVLQDLHLPRRVAGGYGDRRRAELLGAVVQAEAAGEQAVAVGDVHEVVLRAADADDAARRARRPDLDVVLRVADDRLLARRARGRVDARELLARHGEQAERVGVAQVRLRRERQLRDVFDAADVAGQQPHLVKALLVKRHVFIAAVHDLHKALRLDLPQRLTVGTFDFRIVILHGNNSFLVLRAVAERKGTLVHVEEFRRHGLFDRRKPAFLRDVERGRHRADQHDVHGLLRAGLLGEAQRVHRREAHAGRLDLFEQRRRVGRRPGDHGHRVDLLRIRHDDAALFQVRQIPRRFKLLEREQNVRLALVDNGRFDALAPAHIGDDAAAALAHAVHLADLYVVARVEHHAPEHAGGEQRSLAAHADDHNTFHM